MKLVIDHIAVLVRNLERTASLLPERLARNSIESFPEEGTKEQYIDFTNTRYPSLLLLEAIGEGPYLRALKKRGPGLHHFGYVTDDLESSVSFFSEQRLLLHPVSLETLKRKTVWLCRPGIPFLIELSENDELIDEEQRAGRIPVMVSGYGANWLPGIEFRNNSESVGSLMVDGVAIDFE